MRQCAPLLTSSANPPPRISSAADPPKITVQVKDYTPLQSWWLNGFNATGTVTNRTDVGANVWGANMRWTVGQRHDIPGLTYPNGPDTEGDTDASDIFTFATPMYGITTIRATGVLGFNGNPADSGEPRGLAWAFGHKLNLGDAWEWDLAPISWIPPAGTDTKTWSWQCNPATFQWVSSPEDQGTYPPLKYFKVTLLYYGGAGGLAPTDWANPANEPADGGTAYVDRLYVTFQPLPIQITAVSS